jgi:hypothetical protein
MSQKKNIKKSVGQRITCQHIYRRKRRRRRRRRKGERTEIKV